MKIIVQKTNFYSDDTFFKEVLQQKNVNAISLNIIFNKSGELFVYNYNLSNEYLIHQIETLFMPQLNIKPLETLENTLLKIRNYRKELEVYLNLIPVDINIIDDKSLEEFNNINTAYIKSLEIILKKFPDLVISIHSINRSLASLVKTNIPKRRTGIVISSLDLNPSDFSYYIFFTYMINNQIFLELLKDNKEVIIFVNDENDLATINYTYSSDKSTALASNILSKLSFITNQPNLLNKVLSNF